MTYIDAAILALTEWCCRRFQLLTGRTNIWLALQLTNTSGNTRLKATGVPYDAGVWPLGNASRRSAGSVAPLTRRPGPRTSQPFAARSSFRVWRADAD